jgi:hypothetical protein
MKVYTVLTRARRSAAALALDPIPASKAHSDPLEFAEFDKHNSCQCHSSSVILLNIDFTILVCTRGAR